MNDGFLVIHSFVHNIYSALTCVNKLHSPLMPNLFKNSTSSYEFSIHAIPAAWGCSFHEYVLWNYEVFLYSHLEISLIRILLPFVYR